MQNKYPVDNISEEHDNINNLVNSVGNAMSDLDALFRLEHEQFNLSQTSLISLSEKTGNMKDMIDDLWKNLKEHFSYEEQHLPAVLGDTLTKALLVAHKDIADEIERVKIIISESTFEGLTRPEVLAKKTMIQEDIGKLCRMIEEHAKDEDVLIKLVKKATRT